MVRRALITGIAGQDGSYLAEFLLGQAYAVYGLVRDETTDLSRIDPFIEQLQLLQGDLQNSKSLELALGVARPHEVYNLAAQSGVHSSWGQVLETGESNALGVARLLETIRNVDPQIRFYQASTSELFGIAEVAPQAETTPFKPRTPYGVAKLYGHWLTANYRQHYGLFACCGILFNHESPRRGQNFVTRKITRAVARIKLGLEDRLALGNLEARRDWGFAGDYVQAMWRMMQLQVPEDFVIGSGVDRSVRDFCSAAFAHAGLDWKSHVVVDPQFFRVEEGEILVGDIKKAREKLAWTPQTSFEDMVGMMVDSDLAELAGRAV